MVIQWRIEYEGALYHVLSRGNERRNIFFDDDDRICFLETLGQMANRFEIQNDAYRMSLSCYIHRNPLRAGMVKRHDIPHHKQDQKY